MIFEKVVEIICAQLPVKPENVKMESRLVEDLGADSANIMIMCMDIEQEFDIQVDDDILTKIETVGDVVAYLEKNIE